MLILLCWCLSHCPFSLLHIISEIGFFSSAWRRTLMCRLTSIEHTNFHQIGNWLRFFVRWKAAALIVIILYYTLNGTWKSIYGSIVNVAAIQVLRCSCCCCFLVPYCHGQNQRRTVIEGKISEKSKNKCKKKRTYILYKVKSKKQVFKFIVCRVS